MIESIRLDFRASVTVTYIEISTQIQRVATSAFTIFVGSHWSDFTLHTLNIY